MEGERVQRRLAAILAADVAGYSRLTGADEEGTLLRLRALRRELIDPAVDAHYGRIVKTTGDGLLVEFSSVVDAVRCALEVQGGIAFRNRDLPSSKCLEFRIGIHVGDVVVEGDDLLGDGVNVAARLEGVAQPGGVCLSADAYRQVRGKVDLVVQDWGEQQLKNIPLPVHLYAISTDVRAVPQKAGSIPTSSASSAPRLSIVVLPFANLGSEPDYFVDGITENLTTDLSRISGAFVIACKTALAYKSKAVDARQVGRDLGVRYILEGSVQSSGNRIRVNAQLIDAETGAHLWAERFDKPRTDLFDMQDEITCMLARVLDIELIAAESRRALRERSNSMDAVDLTMRGRAIWNQPFSVERSREARRWFEAALRLDAQNVNALLGLADTYSTEVANFLADNPTEQIQLAEAAVSKALNLAPNSAFAHHLRGTLLLRAKSRAPDQALRQFELAIILDRNFPWAYAMAGVTKVLLGRAEEAEAYVAQAIRLSPRDPWLDFWYLFIGVANIHLMKLDQAVERLRSSADLAGRGCGFANYLLAAALALAGREAEARDACATGQRLNPKFSIGKFRAGALSDNPLYLAGRERICEGMRRAGVPEE